MKTVSHHFRGFRLGAKLTDLRCELFLEQHGVGQSVQSGGVMFDRRHRPGRGEVSRRTRGTLELRHAAPQGLGEHLPPGKEER